MPASQLQAPRTLEEAGLTLELVTQLALKILHYGGELTGAELVWALRHEGALDVDDLLDRRTRIGLVPSDRPDINCEHMFVSYVPHRTASPRSRRRRPNVRTRPQADRAPPQGPASSSGLCADDERPAGTRGDRHPLPSSSFKTTRRSEHEDDNEPT